LEKLISIPNNQGDYHKRNEYQKPFEVISLFRKHIVVKEFKNLKVIKFYRISKKFVFKVSEQLFYKG